METFTPNALIDFTLTLAIVAFFVSALVYKTRLNMKKIPVVVKKNPYKR